MIRKIVLIASLFMSLSLFGQSNEEKLVVTLKEFHQALVTKNTVSINQQTDKVLSYGHSNGWVETKTDMIKNLETGYIDYHSIKEDSLHVVVSGNLGHARFVGDYNVTLNGNTNTFHLKVLEVWVKKGKRWLLFARQAVK
jgi:hypothetical protein